MRCPPGRSTDGRVGGGRCRTPGRGRDPRRRRPHFLEARTYRFRAHSMFDPERTGTRRKCAAWRERDPIDLLREALDPDDETLQQMEDEIAAEVEDAVAYAEESPDEDVADLMRFVYSPDSTAGGEDLMATITYREAVRQAIRTAMKDDERVFMMGEDIGAYGGCFGVSMGLFEEFGPERIRDTHCRSPALWAPGSGPRSVGCGRSSRS